MGLQATPGQLRDPRFWAQAWQEANSLSPFALRRPDYNAGRFWSAMAGQLQRSAHQEWTVQRVERILSFIEGHRLCLENLKVLDVGCGIGTFSIAFASRGARVTALDPASTLLEKLEERLQKQPDIKVETVRGTWGKGASWGQWFHRSFDLAFSSLNPGMRDYDALEMLIASSRGACLLCDLAPGSGGSPWRSELWPALFNNPMPITEYSILYPLNYLLARGFRPSYLSWSETWQQNLTLREAVAHATAYFSLYRQPDKKMRGLLERYFIQRLDGQFYREAYRVNLGMIFWFTGERDPGSHNEAP